jgi:hypothetical protein
LKTKLIITTLALATTTIIGCKKYSNDSKISLATAKERLTKTWTLDEMYRNNVNVSDSIKKLIDSYTLTFTKAGTFEYVYDKKLTIGTIIVPLHYTRAGNWSFEDKKNTIALVYNDNNKTEKLPILKLTKDNLWVTLKDSTTNYELHFKK